MVSCHKLIILIALIDKIVVNDNCKMKTLIQKIYLNEEESFACRTYRTPDFETNWHKHDDFELIVISEGHGTIMMGDHVGAYKTGDVFFLAGNLPHWFKKQHHKMIGSALVLHFKRDIFGMGFLDLSECKNLQQLLQKNDGLQLLEPLKKDISAMLFEIETLQGFQRMNLLLQCLQKISTSYSHVTLTQNFESSNAHINPAIEKIIDYSFKHYLTAVTLQEVAKVASMSIPTFCRFFKKNIKKTYFGFIQDLRISHAGKLLANTNKPILEICYESGYNSWAHFSKQFKQVKKMTPSKYRITMAGELN